MSKRYSGKSFKDSSVNKKGNTLVKKKDPEEFYKILKFHKSKENDFKYQ